MTPRQLAYILTATVLATGCGQTDRQDNTHTVPKPTAYPRLPLPATDSMTVATDTPVQVLVNSAATVLPTHHDRTPGLTVTYPGLGATIYFTFIPVTTDNVRDIVDARLQRIDLNLSGATANTLHTTPDSPTEGILVTATTGTQTPVQMLAMTPGYVVTATAFLANPDVSNNYDSIKPLVQLLHDDLSRAIPGTGFRHD